MSLILLDIGNKILGETVGQQINLPADEERTHIDVRLNDFDDVSYRVTIAPEDKDTMLVSMNCPCYSQIEEKGGKSALTKYYSDLSIDPVDSHHVTLKVDLKNLPAEQKAKDELTRRIQNLKANVVGGAFDHWFQECLDGKTSDEKFKFDQRGDTTVYFFPGPERVTVVYQLDFQDRVDKAIAKVFFQEFQDARRQANLGRAPPVNFSVAPPLELGKFGITENVTKSLGYLSFAIQKSHLDKNKKESVIGVMQSFRTFIQYHIMCSKSFFNARMRARCKSLLQVLKRAEQEPLDDGKEKKTVTGKTFQRDKAKK